MAAKGKTRTSRKKTAGQPDVPSGRSRSRDRSQRRGWLLLDLLRLSWLGRVLLAVLLIAAVLGVNLLVSANQYDLFFILAGIELVAVALFFWLRLVLKRS